jgi:hypothetical protein
VSSSSVKSLSSSESGGYQARSSIFRLYASHRGRSFEIVLPMQVAGAISNLRFTVFTALVATFRSISCDVPRALVIRDTSRKSRSRPIPRRMLNLVRVSAMLLYTPPPLANTSQTMLNSQTYEFTRSRCLENSFPKSFPSGL